jgi:exopolysaccharide production protein ExoY
MMMLEQMRTSQEPDFEIAPSKGERLEPATDRSPCDGFVSAPLMFVPKDYSATDSAFIRDHVRPSTQHGHVILKSVALKPVALKPTTKPVRTVSPVSRIVDVTIAAILLVLLLPAMISIAVFLKVAERGPVFFAHRRVGLGGKSFDCLKFRTMCVDADLRLAKVLASDEALLREWVSTQKLHRDPRVTRFGQILRNTSLDELPQLMNVLRGEMSLVGPRPIVEDEMRRYGRYAALYTSVRPGLTGLWQITRNAETSYRRRVATDVLYVQSRTLKFDCKILLATIPAVLVGNG